MTNAQAQTHQYEQVTLQWVTDDKVHYSQIAPSSLDSVLNISLKKNHAEGYLAYSIDSIQQLGDTIVVQYYKGNQYQWNDLKIDTSVIDALQKAKIPIPFFSNKIVNVDELIAINKALLKHMEREGRPFSQIAIKEITIDDHGGLSARYGLQFADALMLDTVIVHADFNVYKPYLLAFLDVKEKGIYNPQSISRIPKNIGLLPFARIDKPHELRYKIDRTELHIYLKEKKVNTVNALLGLQPREQSNRYQVTADVLASIQNYFGMGEALDFSYNQIQGATRRMTSRIAVPYILGTKWGSEIKINIMQQDTTFRRIDGSAGLSYFFKANNAVAISINYNSNRQITVDTQFVRINKKLPINADIISVGTGIDWKWNDIDDITMPRKGYDIHLSMQIQNRKILKNAAIADMDDGTGYDYNTLYDSIVNSKKVQYRLQSSVSYYISPWRMITLKAAVQNGYIASQPLFRNELYQIGGFKLLRGFNELSIFAQQYHLLTIEPRLILGVASYIYPFTDMGIITTQGLNDTWQRNTVLSFGMGGALQTANGIFNIAIGLGKMNQEAIRFSNARVHFGYAIRF